jgi:hypothetical protein
MNQLQIDWQQERPDALQLKSLWDSLKISKIDNWTTATKLLIDTITETHSNGGIQLHKYKVSANKHFDYFASRNFNELDFLKKILGHKALQDYRENLQISIPEPSYRLLGFKTDMYDLAGYLSRVMGKGGAYRGIDQGLAWQVATDFIEAEFQNRFEELLMYELHIESAKWFCGISWDYAVALFDKRNYEIVFIDITDSD